MLQVCERITKSFIKKKKKKNQSKTDFPPKTMQCWKLNGHASYDVLFVMLPPVPPNEHVTGNYKSGNCSPFLPSVKWLHSGRQIWRGGVAEDHRRRQNGPPTNTAPQGGLGARWRTGKHIKAVIVQTGIEEDGGHITYHTNDRRD